jgi:AI-2E family transporter
VPTLWAEAGIGAAVIMLIVVLAYQQLENNMLTPKIQSKAVNLSAFFIIIAVTLFGALLGVRRARSSTARRDDPVRRARGDNGAQGAGGGGQRRAPVTALALGEENVKSPSGSGETACTDV